MAITEVVAQLINKWCDSTLLNRLYGIVLPDELLLGHFRMWSQRLRTKRFVENSEGLIDRHSLELFFQFAGVMPMKFASAQLGMTKESLDVVLTELESREILIINSRDFSSQLIDEKIIRDFRSFFTSTSSFLFKDHDDFCKAIHEAIASELDFKVEPQFCCTSTILDASPDFSYTYDYLTLEPLGLRYQIWLQTGKPIRLRPDLCSLKTYVKNKAVLDQYLFSGERKAVLPEIEKLILDA